MKHQFFTAILGLALSLNIQAQSQFNLTKTQMLEDFDLAIAHIDTFAVHKDLNAIRLNIDYDQQFSRLRSEINSQTSYCQFHDILEKALNLVQDLHTSFMTYDYLRQYGKYQKKLNISDDDSYDAIQHYESHCVKTPPKLTLPIIYKDGGYFFYADFQYHATTVKRGTQILSYNNQPIEQFITSHYDTVWPVKLDQDKQRVYNAKFYRFGGQEFSLKLADGETISFKLDSEIQYLKENKRDIYYQSQTKVQMHYFEPQGIVYLGLPMMDVNFAESLNQQISALVSQKKQFSKVIIDIRGNPGGNDQTWRKLVAHLYAKSFPLSLTPKFKFNPSVLERYASQRDKVIPETEPLLNNAKYWTMKFNLKTTEISPDSVDFKGKVYLLQDEYIYSSAGNFSNFALTNDEFISVGNTTDLVGGAQVEPLFYRLKNTQLVFRVEPMLDFSNVTTLNDFAHNDVEVKIAPTIEDNYLRTTFEGDIYGQDFLFNHDRLFQYVVGQQ